jgi:hypothetical protein
MKANYGFTCKMTANQAIVAHFADILADEPAYDDFIAVDGKASY